MWVGLRVGWYNMHLKIVYVERVRGGGGSKIGGMVEMMKGNDGRLESRAVIK